jgi:hypothetical protein
LASALALLVPPAGCGYGFRADGRPVGLEIRSLSVPLVSSTSSSMAFEADFTKVIRQEFISHANVPILPREQAHMVLVGHVRSISTDALTYDLDMRTVNDQEITYAVTDSRRLTVEMEAELLDGATGRTVWKDADLTEEAGFRVSPDPLVTRHNQRQALRKIAERLAKRVYLKTMERF